MKKNFDIYETLFWPIFRRRKLEKKYIHRKHKFDLSIWRHHVEILKKTFCHAEELRKYLSEEGFNYMYDQGECMIYIYLDSIKIYYPDFIQKKYTYEDEYWE